MDKSNEEEEFKEAFAMSSDLSSIVSNIREENSNKPKLLADSPRNPSLKKTLVFEMDDVLLHTFTPHWHEGYMHKPMREHDAYVEINELNALLSVYFRPQLPSLLEFIEGRFENVVFSTGDRVYVDKMMDLFDPERKIFPHRLYLEHCNEIDLEEENIVEMVKDLGRLDRDISSVIFIDSRPMQYWLNPENCYPILEYLGEVNQADEEIPKLIDFLKEIEDVNDVRGFMDERFGMKEVFQSSKLSL